MRNFLQRISSRKFLTAMTVQAAALAALFWPRQEASLQAAAVQIASLAAMLLAALGYGAIEAAVDGSAAAAGGGADPPAAQPTGPAGVRAERY